jgi:uncharacterized lipoprotein YmbA
MTKQGNIVQGRDTQIRQDKKNKEREQQAKEMRQRWVDDMSNQMSAIDMSKALREVRKSDVSIPTNLSRFHGSYLYNKQD